MPIFKPCITIPIYNHYQMIKTTVEAILTYKIPIIIVDDGSNQQTQTVLQELKQQYSELTLYHLPQNQGKGAAVIYAMHKVAQLDFSHVLQVDADGQHQFKDIPKFIKLATDHPDSLICGQPIYDESIPRSRKIARNITHFWVGIEILSLNPPDSMCGFRVYPLLSTLKLLKKQAIGQRMNFDIEILVRLIWQKVDVINIKTQVIYPKDGMSNFHYLKDNLLISWMHTQLFFGMLKRFPALVWFKLTKKKSKHWSKINEKGSILGIKILLWIFRLIGRRGVSLFLIPVLTYYFIFSRQARKASQQYLMSVYKAPSEKPYFSAPPRLYHSYRHFLTFGFAVLDKMAAWGGQLKYEEIVFKKRPTLIELAKQGKGALILSAHLGSAEMTRILATDEIKINTLIFSQHAEKINQILKSLNNKGQDLLIPVQHMDMSVAILLKEKIAAGEFVVIFADRTSVNADGRNEWVNFLGHPAPFGQGPFILGSLLECPVYLLLCLKKQNYYDVELEFLTEQIKLPRKNRQQALQQYIEQYAQRLSHYCLKYPYQWYNFFDFWNVGKKK